MTSSAAAARSPVESEPPAGEELPGACRRILVLAPQFPYPPHQGTTIRNYNLIVHLAARHEVHLLSFGDPQAAAGTPLQGACRSVQLVRPPAPRTPARRLAGVLLSRLPDMAQRLPSAQFRAALAATLARESLDVVQVEGIELAEYLFQAAAIRAGRPRPLLVYDDHNAEYVLQQRAFETDARSGRPGRWPAAAYSLVQWQRLRGYERRACGTADRVVAVSDADADALRRLAPELAPVVVPNGVDMAHYTAAPPPAEGPLPDAGDVVFTGKMDFRPNVDAVLWFVEAVLPLLRDRRPDLCFWIVGQAPHERVAALGGRPGVVVTGRVADVRPYIGAAGVYAVPLRIGGGTRLKVLEAMAMGKAIVSTRLGCEGFDLEPGQDLALADEPGAFADAVLGLLADPARRERMGRAGRRFAGSRYDWRVIVPRLERVYE